MKSKLVAARSREKCGKSNLEKIILEIPGYSYGVIGNVLAVLETVNIFLNFELPVVTVANRAANLL